MEDLVAPTKTPVEEKKRPVKKQNKKKKGVILDDYYDSDFSSSGEWLAHGKIGASEGQLLTRTDWLD